MTDIETAKISTDETSTPDLSLVVPCYNEEACLEETMPPLANAFSEAGISLQLVLVDNGSTDKTTEVIDRLIARGLPITKGSVDVNRGQGRGFLTGFDLARGRHIGFTCADGQVLPKDVVAICRAVIEASTPTLAKALRRSRQDGWIRYVVSVGFNTIMRIVFPRVQSFDINGNPKIMPADILRKMELESQDWFLEAEVMLKAWRLGLPVCELSVHGLKREAGDSSVSVATALEFVRNIFVYRFGGPWSDWCKRVRGSTVDEP